MKISLRKYIEVLRERINIALPGTWVTVDCNAAIKLIEVVEAQHRALESLTSYTEACEGLLNASPAGQVIAARAALTLLDKEES